MRRMKDSVDVFNVSYIGRRNVTVYPLEIHFHIN